MNESVVHRRSSSSIRDRLSDRRTARSSFYRATRSLCSPPLPSIYGSCPSEAISLSSLHAEEETYADEGDEEEDDGESSTLHLAPPERASGVGREYGREERERGKGSWIQKREGGGSYKS